MKMTYEQFRRDAEAAGLDLQQIHAGYEENPIPFALLRILPEGDGARDAEFVYANSAFEKLSIPYADRLAGQTYRKVFPEATEEEVEKLLAADFEQRATAHGFLDTIGRHLRVGYFRLAPGYVGCIVQVLSQQKLSPRFDIDDLAIIGEIVEGGLLVTTLESAPQVVYCSETLYQLLGDESMEALQERIHRETLYANIHPSDVESLRKMADALSRQEKMHTALRARKKTGEYVWLSVRCKRSVLQGRRVVISMTYDLTEDMMRVVREHKMLMNTNAQYYATYYLDVNTAVYHRMQQSLTTYAPDIPVTGDYNSAVMRYVENYVHPDDREELVKLMRVSEFYRRAQRVDGNLNHSHRYRRKFGERYEWVELAMAMSSGENAGEEAIITCTFRNIHQEKLAEKEKRYMEVLSYALAHSYEAVLEVDTAGKILYELQMGENGLYRCPSLELNTETRYRYAATQIHQDDADRFLKEFTMECLEEMKYKKKMSFEYRRRAKIGDEYRWCSYTLRRFVQGEHDLLILFVKDIHEERERYLREQICLKQAVVESERRVYDKNRQLVSYYGKTLELMSSVVEYRSLESGGHVRRIKSYTKELLKAAVELFPEQNLTEDKIRDITEASALHDVGKIGVPDNILLKPARLTKEEFEVMKRHTVIGADIAREIPCVTECADESSYGYEIARYHHERYDGKGYPDGLQGDEIPFSAQIVAIADVYDALTTVRVYKEAYSNEEAFNMIMNGECGTFSPRMLRCFEKVRERFASIQRQFAEK